MTSNTHYLVDPINRFGGLWTQLAPVSRDLLEPNRTQEAHAQTGKPHPTLPLGAQGA